MPCHGRSQTPLERFAESLRAQQSHASEEGRAAADLGRELRAPDFFMEALEGRPAVCRRMAFVATAKSYLETVSF
eukprot:s385_g19.t1